MNSRYLLALVTVIAVQSGSAFAVFDVFIDGERFTGDQITIQRANTPLSNNNTPPPDNNNTPPPSNNTNTPPPNGGDCSGNFTLIEEPLQVGRTRRTMGRNQVTAFRFREEDLATDPPLIQFGESVGGPSGTKLVTISDCAGEHDVTEIQRRIGPNCVRRGTSGAFWLEFGNANNNNEKLSHFTCKLVPDGRFYYINVLYWDFDTGEPTCPAGQNCSFLIDN